MGSFKVQLPTEIIREMESVATNYEKIFGGMTQAGAAVVRSMVESNVPEAMRSSDIMSCLKTTVTYKTPSDDGINTKVAFYGYFNNEKGVKTPAPLVCNMFEYGSSEAHKNYPKQPFMRKSFNKGAITSAMMKAQRELSGGLLDE